MGKMYKIVRYVPRDVEFWGGSVSGAKKYHGFEKAKQGMLNTIKKKFAGMDKYCADLIDSYCEKYYPNGAPKNFDMLKNLLTDFILRPEELEWELDDKYSDIDFERKTMMVRKNITTAKKRDTTGKAVGGVRSIEGTPKTKESATVVPINDTAVAILKDMLQEEAKGYSGYIANDDGKALGESAIRKHFDNLLRHAGIEHCGMHSLRHTFASKLYELTRGDSKLVSELVRHTSVSFTEEIYIHLKEKYKQDTIANFSI